MSDLIELKFVELHNPLFFAGKNWGVKLDPGKSEHSALILQYDRAEKELLIEAKGEKGIVPSSNIACMVTGKVEVRIPQYTHPIVAGIQSAQVETPMSHVHAGYGHGKTGIGGKVK